MGGLLSAIFGGGSSNNAVNQASGAAQTNANNATKVNQELMNLISSFASQFQSNYAPLQGPEMGGLMSLMQQIPGIQSVLNGPSAMSSAAPALTGFYSNEMTQGLDPTFQRNAQNQLEQNFAQSESDILAHAAPGMNPAAQLKGAQDQLLANSTNLAGQLAGESQQVKAQGASGLESAAGAIDAGQLQRISAAIGIPMEVLQSIASYIGQGQGLETAGLGPLGGLGAQYSNAATADTNLAIGGAQQQQQQQSGLFNSLIGLAANYFMPGIGMGAANPILSVLGGGPGGGMFAGA